MDSKTKIGRRGFLKSGAKMLPVLAVVGFAAAVPLHPAKADCDGGCGGNCTSYCKGNCKDDCMGSCFSHCGSTAAN